MSLGPRTLPCPNCNEMINESVKQCGYCLVALDPGVAQLIADKQQKANQACSEASYLRTAAVALYVFLGLSMIPVLPFFIVLLLEFRWYSKFYDLVTSDPDYEIAWRSWRTSLILVIAAFPLGFIVGPIIQRLIFGLNAVE